MFEGWFIAVLAVAYVGGLFLIAWRGDKARVTGTARPLIYSLSLAVYCTSWTFFGSVGLAADTGYDFIPVYLGPILVFLLGLPLLTRIVRLAKSQNLTSVSDFLAARYGKSPAVAAIVTVVAVVGTLPYIALQLKAIVISTETLLGGTALEPVRLTWGLTDTALITTLALALFAILFGTRHIDATEHQSGLMLAVAAESVLKLAAFIGVGIFVLYNVLGGPANVVQTIRANSAVLSTFDRTFNGGTWLTVTLLSAVAIVLLPRQFHVTVVENHSERELRRASWLFPSYLVAINLFVVPIAAAGLIMLPKGLVDPDMFVLALPMAKGSEQIAVLAFLGGLSAATAMVVVETVALSIMICNGLVVPLVLKHRLLEIEQRKDLASLLLVIRRIAIVAVLLCGFVVYKALGQAQGLAAIGLISFAAIAQLAPAFFGGLVWRRGTARGAIAGMLVGFVVWGYTLLLPWIVKAGLLPADILRMGPLGIAALRPQALFYLSFEPLTHGVVWSLFANITAYVAVSLWRAPEPIERLQAHIFVYEDLPRATPQLAFRLWRTTLTVGDLQATVVRYLGADRAERSFAEYAASRNLKLNPQAEADLQTLRFTEHLLTSAIGAASARLVMALLLRRGNVGSPAALKLLDDASEALQYNRDLLQSALDQVRHGLGVFDRDMNLVCWNRQFRELLGLPEDLGRVGTPLRQILRVCADRGDFGPGNVEALVADRFVRLSVHKETIQEQFGGGRQILEFRIAAMPQPQGGIVCTISDITERVVAADELARANETLELRVKERTQALEAANSALEAAKLKADEANLDKTRFLAAASHDLMQPLNAARLYASSLVERQLPQADKSIAHNIDASLTSVEEIISALIDISRLDAGRLEPEVGSVSLGGMLDSLAVEFKPLAAEKGLTLQLAPSGLWVRSDRRLLKRVLQNLIGNAIKYTERGCVSVVAGQNGGRVRIEVQDTGPGIHPSQHGLIFKEFRRGDGVSAHSRGLGLGLSIVQRVCKVLDMPLGLSSVPGAGSTFWVEMEKAEPLRTPVAIEETATAVSTGMLAGMAVICIDNELAVLDGMNQLLTGWGCQVKCASSAEEAGSILTDSGFRPRMILADYHLDRGTGPQAVAVVRGLLGADIPAVVITADHSPEVQNELREAGIPLLRKPLKAAALRSIVMHFASSQRAAAE
jgi:Na+/proline symporter/signal transduction histidine kinase/CheY-like chemotaxis protein